MLLDGVIAAQFVANAIFMRRDAPSSTPSDSTRTSRDPAPRPDPYLVKALRRARQMLAQHGGGPVGRPEQALPGSAPDGPYERRLIRLAFLAPDLQAKILEGRQPRGLTLKALLRWEPPADWRSQRMEFEALG